MWTLDKMLEVLLKDPDDFLKIKETLTRMGVSSKDNTRLYQSCHILHKRGKYYIVHFKEMFAIDGKEARIDETDIQRRNTIAQLLSDWGLLTLKKPLEDMIPVKALKIISHKDKENWELITKYKMGNTK